MTTPPVPPEIAAALSRYSPPVQTRLLDIRALIFEIAESRPGVGPLTETLKWGEAAYLTEASKSGSTIRLGAPKFSSDQCAVYFNCNTNLVETFRSQFPDAFGFEGNRALILPVTAPLPRDALALCLGAALTYHRKTKTSAAPSAPARSNLI